MTADHEIPSEEEAENDYCEQCGEDLSGGSSHYHCSVCGEECSMMGHWRIDPNHPAGGAYSCQKVLVVV